MHRRSRWLALGLVMLVAMAMMAPAVGQDQAAPAPRLGPINDHFIQATPWYLGQSPLTGQSNVGATTEGPEPLSCVASTMGATVWYTMRVTTTSSVFIQADSFDFDTVLAVYLGSPVGSLTQVTCNDDVYSGATNSEVTFTAYPGFIYRIQVAGYQGATGSFSLRTDAPLTQANDLFADANPIGGAATSISSQNYGGTTEQGEPLLCGTSPIGATVWHTLTVPAAGPVTLNTTGAAFDTILAVYTGSAVGALTPVACNDDYGGNRASQVQFNAQPGVTYRIQVGGYAGERGYTPLNIARTAAAPLCNGQAATIRGSASAETLYGTANDDVIVGLGGNDTIYGYGGNDVICAGPGADRVFGGPGRDRLYGQGGADRLEGEAGNDRLIGGASNDVLIGGDGTDRLRGGAGINTCSSGENVVC